MVSCPQCEQESPASSKHCVHCGRALPSDAVARTQLGMPIVHLPPLGGPGTGESPLVSNPLLAAGSGRPAAQDASPSVQSLLAGLPRPRVSSTPSPLTAGRFSPSSPPGGVVPLSLSEPSSQGPAGQTMMGMPIINRQSLSGLMPGAAQVKPAEVSLEKGAGPEAQGEAQPTEAQDEAQAAEAQGEAQAAEAQGEAQDEAKPAEVSLAKGAGPDAQAEAAQPTEAQPTEAQKPAGAWSAQAQRPAEERSAEAKAAPPEAAPSANKTPAKVSSARIESSDGAPAEEGGGMKILWIVVAVAALAAAGWYFTQGG